MEKSYMEEYFQTVNGCEVIVYHKGTAGGRGLYFFLSYLPFILMLTILGTTIMKSYELLWMKNDCSSSLLACIFVGVLILLLDVAARITKEEKKTAFQECCIIRCTGTITDIDMYWIKELYDLQQYKQEDVWMVTQKKAPIYL